LSQYDEKRPEEQENESAGPRSRRNNPSSPERKSAPREEGRNGAFFTFMQKITDPARRRKRNLPDPADFPEGQVPLWVSNPENYERRRSGSARFFAGLGTVVLHLVLICGIIGVTALGIAAAVVYSFSDTALDERFASMDLDYSSFIYATDPVTGTDYVYQEIQSTSGTRVWASDTEIPQHVKDATVALEDQRFYRHSGVDPIRTVRAVLEYAWTKISKSGSRASGGSTLTQQVIKNMTGDDDYGVTRKVKEMLQALYIERRYNKDQILEYYLNTVYFGQSAHGISAAADIYFGKTPEELTIAEGAAIVCITKSPGSYNPYLNPEKNKDRRNDTIWFMYDQGYITEEEYEQAIHEELQLRDLNEEHEVKENEDGIFLYNYYTDMVIRDVLQDLKTKKGYTEAEAYNLLYHGGLQIYSCVDADIQTMMEEYAANEENFKYAGSDKDTIVNDKGETEVPQMSMMVMDPDTGNILGIVGGRGEKKGSLDLNRATDSLRQPGSSIKPLSVYGYAVEHDLLFPGSAIDDIPVTYDKKENKFWPSNYDQTYSGLISVKRALALSLNAPAAWALKQIGIQTSFDFMKNSLHFTTLVEADSTSLAPLSVGALTDGVTLREMTTAYTAFAAGDGMYTAYRSYSKVVGHDGKVVLDNSIEREAVFSEQTVYLMTDMMMSAVDTIAGKADLGKIQTAGKSGTTTSYKDRWFIGYTPYYLAGIWWGYDTPSELNNTHHFSIWNGIMSRIHEMKGLSSGEFAKPSGIVSCAVCTKSGMLPGPYCSTDQQGSCVQTFYYKEGTQPTKTCDVHHQLYICLVSGRIAHEGCPKAELRTYVDIDRSFVSTVKVKDAGYICPRLTVNDVLYVHPTLPVYTHMVPEGETPCLSLYGHVNNTICTDHQPSATPHLYVPPAVSTDTSGPVSSGGATDQPTSDTGTPTDQPTDTSTPTDSGTTDSGTTSDTGGSSDS